MNDLLVEDSGWDVGDDASPTGQEKADALLALNAQLKAADQAILEAQHLREVIWARERDARAALHAQMTKERITRIDRPLGSIHEITARTTLEPDGSRRVISIGGLRILPPRPAPPADPLFVFRAAERAVATVVEEAPVSERRRRAG